MRITYRTTGNKDYWQKRWSKIPADAAMGNVNSYPLKYAVQTIRSRNGKILEAGCGAGRILRYFKDRGYNIIGIDFIETAIEKLKEVDPQLDVAVGDITDLKYDNEYFLAISLLLGCIITWKKAWTKH
jgi:SAM-dependent methyltransferase